MVILNFDLFDDDGRCPVEAQTKVLTDDWRKLTPETVVVLLLPPADERQLDLSSGGRSETFDVVFRPMVAHRSPTCAGCCLRLQGVGGANISPAAPVDARDRLSGPQI